MIEPLPPYPTPGTNIDRQFGLLVELSRWADNERTKLPEVVREITTQINARLGVEASVTSYRIQPIPVLSMHYLSMQTIRREWDEAARLYPDAWDSVPAIRTRTLLVNAAACLFNNAFLPYETREARAARDAESLKRLLFSVLAIFETGQEEPPKGT